MKVITGAQIRAGRALLRWSAGDLARQAKLADATVRRAETFDEKPMNTEASSEAIRRALESAGVQFIEGNGEGPGVRLKKRAKSAEEVSRQIEALEEKISSIPAPMEPSPEAAMNTMRKAVAESDLTKLKARRKRVRRDRSK